MKKLKDVYFRKTDLASSGNMTFDQNMLTLLMAIDEDKSVFEISRQTNLEAFDGVSHQDATTAVSYPTNQVDHGSPIKCVARDERRATTRRAGRRSATS